MRTTNHWWLLGESPKTLLRAVEPFLVTVAGIVREGHRAIQFEVVCPSFDLETEPLAFV